MFLAAGQTKKLGRAGHFTVQRHLLEGSTARTRSPST
jgi:hypothetical protein